MAWITIHDEHRRPTSSAYLPQPTLAWRGKIHLWVDAANTGHNVPLLRVHWAH